MNFPPSMSSLTGGALQPAFGAAVDIARQEIPAGAAVLRRVRLGQRRYRAPGTGLGIFPGLTGILVASGQYVGGGIAGEGEIAIARHRRIDWHSIDRASHILVVHLGHGIAARQAAAAGSDAD